MSKGALRKNGTGARVAALFLLGGIAAPALVGCERTAEVVGLEAAPPARSESFNGVTAMAGGGGRFVDSWFTGTTWRFAFTAVQRSPEGDAQGDFHFTTSITGLAVAIHARVTCMTIDPEHRRAWIGGVITKNRSEHPAWRDAAVTQVGQPTWFRVKDNGEGADAVQDRTTRNFFTGAGGFQNEWQFCTADPPFWPVVNGVELFTDPLLGGNLQVRPAAKLVH